MLKNLKVFLNEPKPYIGWVHGTITIIGAVILGYLSMMIYSKFISADIGTKIVPSFILTPVLIACFSMWLLFSRTIFKAISKFLILSLIFIIFLKVF